MKILLYNPDNGVTRNFMPHLWMFLLQALTPPGHEVILIDGNARAMTDDEIVAFARAEGAYETARYRVDRELAEQPYRTLALAAGLGVIVGLLMARRERTIIYRPTH